VPVVDERKMHENFRKKIRDEPIKKNHHYYLLLGSIKKEKSMSYMLVCVIC